METTPNFILLQLSTEVQPENEWVRHLEQSQDHNVCLRSFCPHYYYFSLNQVVAFTGIFKSLDLKDTESLCRLGDVLHEELGRNHISEVHSTLFRRFAKAVGTSDLDLAMPEKNIFPGVRAYVQELYRAFSATRPEALAAYYFLESSAVKTYEPLLKVLQKTDIAPNDYKFFSLHAVVEVEHEQIAQQMWLRQTFSDAEIHVGQLQFRRMDALWRDFWLQLLKYCKCGVGFSNGKPLE